MARIIRNSIDALFRKFSIISGQLKRLNSTPFPENSGPPIASFVMRFDPAQVVQLWKVSRSLSPSSTDRLTD
jgi:hypothetical protein